MQCGSLLTSFVGFLDGVDRASPVPIPSGPPPSQWSSNPPQSLRCDRFRPVKIPPALTLNASLKPQPELSSPPGFNYSLTLILSNLHSEIFKNASDVLPLLEPFGAVRRIRLIAPPATSRNSDLKDDTPTRKLKPLPPIEAIQTEEQPKSGDTVDDVAPSKNPKEVTHMGAMVEFSSAVEACAAVAALDGQVYGSVAIQAERTKTKSPKSSVGLSNVDAESVDYG